MTDILVSPGPQVMDVFGPVLLVVGLGIVGVLVLDVLYLVALFLWLAAQGRQQPRFTRSFACDSMGIGRPSVASTSPVTPPPAAHRG